MAARNHEDNQGNSGTRWEGYSDYRSISDRMAKSMDDALEAYASLVSRHSAGAKVSADEAARARRHLLVAAMKLLPELEEDADEVDEYQDILTRWTDTDEDDSPGYLTALHDADLQSDVPDWLEQFALDIRNAGWEIGYLQAGRRTKTESEDEVTVEVNSMFQN